MGNEELAIDEKLKAARRAPSAEDEAYDIRIAGDGTWYYQGTPIKRPALVKLFATVLRRDARGDYWLVTPAERGRITVDDAPFTAVELDVVPGADGGPRTASLTFRTNLDHRVTAGSDHPIRISFNPDTGEPRPYILVTGDLEALIVRPVYYRMVDHASEFNGRTGVWSQGTFFPLDPGP